MLAARPVSVTASRNVLTSLFSDLVVYIALNFNPYNGGCGEALVGAPGFPGGRP